MVDLRKGYLMDKRRSLPGPNIEGLKYKGKTYIELNSLVGTLTIVLAVCQEKVTQDNLITLINHFNQME